MKLFEYYVVDELFMANMVDRYMWFEMAELVSMTCRRVFNNWFDVLLFHITLGCQQILVFRLKHNLKEGVIHLKMICISLLSFLLVTSYVPSIYLECFENIFNSAYTIIYFTNYLDALPQVTTAILVKSRCRLLNVNYLYPFGCIFMLSFFTFMLQII